ncbi:hypothetical protein [Candidatus Nanoperiomorbus periodonticus]|uniref:hypothetical protein n=1 Tax=Candidatus Nanoperiomorbus periodonticus TaxID=2171989 RepID=UPI00101B6F91|nr:hypothetical protein [Candidatus Nanoperiomorbus periodonticus]RYC75026.1 hypothetical protein G52EAM_00648 [Candidatus Nanoperiomorbus periodonticus]
MEVVDRVSKIRPIKSWCGLKQALTATTLALFSVLLMASPVIAVCQRDITGKQTGQPVSEDHTGNIIQLIHLAHTTDTFNTEYGEHSDKDSDYAGTTIALLRNGKVYSWGNNIYGGVGNDTTCTMTSNVYLKQPPCYYNQPQDITKYFGNDKVVKLANRSQRAIAITESGKIYRWGQPPLDEDGKDIIRHPTQYQELAPYHIIGYSGTDHGGPGTVGGGWYAYSDDTIFDISDDKVSMIKPQLNGATIRSVDCVWRIKEFHPNNPDKDEGGLYVLTSTNKLLRVQDDGKTTEITNSEIAKRGGFKQIYHYYAIDHQGGLWLYGHPKYEGESTLVDMHPRLVGSIGTNLPALQEFVNSNGVEISTSTKRNPIVRGVDNHFYYLATYYTNESRLMLNPIDITASTKHQNIRLFHGDAGAVNGKTLEIATDYSNQLFYDYSFIPEGSDTDLVCTTAEGLSMHNKITGENVSLNLAPTLPLRQQPKQDKTGDTAPTCVKIPSDKPKPDPIKPPTPNTPNQPKLPGVPNTGLRDDKVVQLVHSPATFDYYGKVKLGDNETWRDQDYAGTTVVLTESGKLYAWGNNIAGGVGNDTDYGATYNKKPSAYYSNSQDITRFFNGDKIVKLVNHYHTFAAITSSGKVYYWGHRLSDKDKKPIIHPVTLSELSPYHIIGFGRDIDPGNGNGSSSYVASHPDNMSDYLAFSKDTIFALNYDLDTSRLQYHDEAKNRIKPRLSSDITILDVDHIKHRTPTAEEPEPDKGGYYTLTSDHKLLRVLKDGTTSEITNPEIKKRGGFKQLSYAGHYAIDRQGGLWYYGYREGNDSIHDMAKISTSGKLPRLDSFPNVLGPVARGADGVIYAITDTHINSPNQYFLGRSVDPINVGTLLGGKQKIKFLSGEVETRYRGDSGYTDDYYPPKDLPFYDFAFVPQSQPDTVCVGQSGTAYNRIIGENQGPRFETIQPVDGTIPSTCVKLPPWDDGKPKPSPVPGVPGAPGTSKLPGVPNTGSEPDPIVQLVHIPAVINGAINGMAENLTAKDTDYAGTVMALTQSGRVFAWGNNYAGSVGVGTAGFKVPYPESVKSRREGHPEYYDTPQEITKYFGNDKVVRIGRYGHTSIAVTQSGKLYQWGWSYNPPWDWYDRLKNITWTEPTPDPTPFLNKVTGIGGSYGDTYSGGGWLAHGDDTIFTKTSTSQLKDFGDKLKLSLNGATIRSVDYVDFNGRIAQNPQLGIDQSFKTGVYILTSTNKLLRVKNDGTTTEVTNDKIKSRGGIRQIANQYAIDNQGGLWYYGVGMSKDQIYDMSLKTLGGIIPLPQLRDIVGVDLIENDHMLNAWRRPWSSSVLVRGVNGHIYDVSPVETKFSTEDGGYPERRFALTDVTKLLGHDKIKLFDGKIHSAGATKPVDNEAPGLYDYSFVPESKPDTVCTVISGVAGANAGQALAIYNLPADANISVTTTKLVNDVFAPTCVKLPPLLTPDPKPSPTPNPKPTKPTSGIKAPFDRPKAPGAPNTGSQPLFADGYQAPIFARR